MGLFGIMNVSAEDITIDDQVIYQDGYESEWLLGLGKDKKIEVSVDVVSPSGGKLDVYIISSTQMSGYPDGAFTPKIVKEDVASTSFSFKCPDDETYYLVIDNVDNSRSTDAVPTGNITVDYTYTNPLSAIFESAEDAIAWATIICILGIVIIVVVILVIVVVVIKVSGKGKQPPAQPQQPYPPQQYQQPPPGGYQQPYGPPPQQPGGQPPQQPPY